MNEDVKELWIDALETGQINGKPVEQAQDYLRVGDTYLEDGTCVMNACCLGVLTELAVDAGVITRTGQSDDGNWSYLDRKEVYYYTGEEGDPLHEMQEHEDEDLPNIVMEWAGLTYNNPRVPFGDRLDINGVQSQQPLSTLNDEYAQSFAQIAEYIKEYL